MRKQSSASTLVKIQLIALLWFTCSAVGESKTFFVDGDPNRIGTKTLKYTYNKE